jgi:integrase
VARTLRSAKLDSKVARAKLAPSSKPYFISIDEGLHLGYRKGERTKESNPHRAPGRWVLRRYLGNEKYVVESIGSADDFSDADGSKVLTFHQASAKARERAQAIAAEARIASVGPAITVRDAIEEYAAEREEREARYGGRKDRNARARLTKHVLIADEALSAKPLAALTADDLAKWREGLKGRVNAPQRTVNDFKAALNAAARRAKTQLPPTMRDTISDGLASMRAEPVVAREAQVLPDADVRRIISAAWDIDAADGWDGDLGRIVLVLAATGARFSQIVRMTIADVQVEQKRMMVPVSRKGKGVRNPSYIGVRVGDDVLAALTKATTGSRGSQPLFLRPHWRRAGVGRWERSERGPWSSSHELGRIWPAIVSRAGLSAKTVPYALRHSSIVRGLRAGLPVRLVAALHDTSTPMIEAHYARFITDAMDELTARAVIPLTTVPATVTVIERARR